MEHFGLRNLNELPNSDELRRAALPTAPTAEETKPGEKKEFSPAAETESTSQPATGAGASRVEGNLDQVRESAKVDSTPVTEAVENANLGEDDGER
jgi:hypothetical protein